MKYDIAAKAIVSMAKEAILKRFLGIDFKDIKLIEEIAEETVSLKRSDFPIKIVRNNGEEQIILIEIQTVFSKEFVLRLLDYNLKFIPLALILTPSNEATGIYEDEIISFKYNVVRFWEQDPEKYLDEIWLYPFFPLMKNGENIIDKIERSIYHNSEIDRETKADLLTAMAIFAGLKNNNLAIELFKRRRDIMIESPFYDFIREEVIKEGRDEWIKEGIKEGKKEGIKEGRKAGIQEAISLGLELKFGIESLTLMDEVYKIESIRKLEMLKEAIKKVNNVDEISKLLSK